MGIFLCLLLVETWKDPTWTRQADRLVGEITWTTHICSLGSIILQTFLPLICTRHSELHKSIAGGWATKPLQVSGMCSVISCIIISWSHFLLVLFRSVLVEQSWTYNTTLKVRKLKSPNFSMRTRTTSCAGRWMMELLQSVFVQVNSVKMFSLLWIFMVLCHV